MSFFGESVFRELESFNVLLQPSVCVVLELNKQRPFQPVLGLATVMHTHKSFFLSPCFSVVLFIYIHIHIYIYIYIENICIYIYIRVCIYMAVSMFVLVNEWWLDVDHGSF
jgi:hypothetical protein